KPAVSPVGQCYVVKYGLVYTFEKDRKLNTSRHVQVLCPSAVEQLDLIVFSVAFALELGQILIGEINLYRLSVPEYQRGKRSRLRFKRRIEFADIEESHGAGQNQRSERKNQRNSNEEANLQVTADRAHRF